jgi:BlaI family transcriptional regulator, penicillinase repressor
MSMQATPTPGELEILQVLWEHGPSTVRAVNEALSEGRSNAPGYTTTLKLMQIMADKGLVRRDEEQKAHVYRAAVAQRAAQGELLDDLLARAFRGSASGLVLHLLERHRATPAELAEIRAQLDVMQSKGSKAKEAKQ